MLSAIAVITIADKISRVRLTIYSLLVWFTLIVLIYTLFAINIHHRASDGVDYVMFMLFLTYTMIPLSLRYSTVLGLCLSSFHVIVIAGTAVTGKTTTEIIIRQV